MAIRRYGSFTGGIDLPDEKQDTIRRPIRMCGALAMLRVPLGVGGWAAARCVVKVGQRVAAHERLGQAVGEDGVDVFAPRGGLVSAMTTVRAPADGGLADCPAVELTDLDAPPDAGADGAARKGGKPAAAGGDGPAFDWEAAEPEELLARIADGAITTFRRRPMPLVVWLRQARQHHCRTLIANVLEQEPYVSADHRLLMEEGPGVIEGLAIVGKAIEARDLVLAADHRRTHSYDACAAAVERLGVARIALPHKYPMGADTILAKVLTRRETPPGAATMAVGSAILDAATCLAVWRWVCRGRRTLERVVTVAGPRVREPANYLVPFGARCTDLVAPDDRQEALLVHGGPMAGVPCDERAVVTSATAAVLALEADPPPLSTPCIRCGWCTDHCPARLNVAALNDAFELALPEAARRAQPAACVECGVCSYVCPARLPLTHRVKQLKRRLAAPRQGSAAGAAIGRQPA